jgi:uncharacterized protein YegP (UPF0339 family)
MMAGKYDLKKSPSGKHMFNLKAANGQIILTSELYESKKAAENGISSVKKMLVMTPDLNAKCRRKGNLIFHSMPPTVNLLARARCIQATLEWKTGSLQSKRTRMHG